MAKKSTSNIQWHSRVFVILRILELILAIAVIVIVIFRGFNVSETALYYKRNFIPGPRRGGSSDGYSSSLSGIGYGQTYAQYATPFIGISVASLTIIWFIIALFKYFRHTLRPKVSMGWDIIFVLLWLSLVIANAIGMSENGAWVHSIYWNPEQYTIFITSTTTFLLFTCSYFNGRKAHKIHGPGKTVPADPESTQMGSLQPIPETNLPQYSPLKQYSPPSSGDGQLGSVPTGYSSPIAISHYAGSHYVPPSVSQFGASSIPLQYQPPMWHGGQKPL